MSQSSSPIRVLILGGGINGLSCANFIQERWSSDERTYNKTLSVTILTEYMTPHTTGDIAAGMWTPSLIDDTDHENIKYTVLIYCTV